MAFSQELRKAFLSLHRFCGSTAVFMLTDFLEKKGVYNVKLITRARKRGALWRLPKTVPACW